jgi:hypothetical protein
MQKKRSCTQPSLREKTKMGKDPVSNVTVEPRMDWNLPPMNALDASTSLLGSWESAAHKKLAITGQICKKGLCLFRHYTHHISRVV